MAWGSWLRVSIKPIGVRRALPFLVGASVILGLLGPFGSYLAIPQPFRMIHYAVCVVGIGLTVMGLSEAIARWRFAGMLPLWIALMLDLAVAVPGAALIYTSLSVLAPHALQYVRFPELILQTLLISLLFRAVSVLAAVLRPKISSAPAMQNEGPAINPLASALPLQLKRATILALCAEDHYLRVVTNEGEALIHMRLSDAVDLMGSGCLIHRSYWIAERALREERSGKAILINGLELPVSRHRREAFRAFLERQ